VGVQSDLLEQGLDELQFVMDELSYLPGNVMLADLAIARGFDYYTGTVYTLPYFSTVALGVDFPNGHRWFQFHPYTYFVVQ